MGDTRIDLYIIRSRRIHLAVEVISEAVDPAIFAQAATVMIAHNHHIKAVTSTVRPCIHGITLLTIRARKMRVRATKRVARTNLHPTHHGRGAIRISLTPITQGSSCVFGATERKKKRYE